MKELSDLLSKIAGNKLSIFTFGFSLLTFLMDVDSITSNFIENFLYIMIALFVVILLLTVHLIKKRSKKKRIDQKQLESVIKNNKHVVEYKPLIVADIKPILFKRIIQLSSIIMIVILTMGALSFIKLKNAPIYYVKVKIVSTQKEGAAIREKLNTVFSASDQKGIEATLLQRSARGSFADGNYIITINGGYISLKDAEKDYLVTKKLLDSKSLTKLYPLKISGPNYNISLRRKIYYLYRHF